MMDYTMFKELVNDKFKDYLPDYKMSRLNVQKILYKNVQLICRF